MEFKKSHGVRDSSCLPLSESLVLQICKERNGILERSHLVLQNVADGKCLGLFGKLAQFSHEALDAIGELGNVQIGPKRVGPFLTSKLEEDEKDRIGWIALHAIYYSMQHMYM